MQKGAIYARYSSDKQTGETVKTQVAKCREFCEQQGILVCDEFIDEAKTGTVEGGREEYARMLDMSGKGFFDAIIAYKYDRIGRSFVETVRTIYELERYHSVNVYSATEPNDPLVRNILLSVAEDFSRQLSARMFDTMSSNAAQGFHCGGAPPYGYQSVEAPDSSGRTDRKGNPIKHVVFQPHPDQAPVVQRIFQEYGNGISMKKIAHRLNTEGVTAPGGGTWDLSAVRYILYNETYRGLRIWNKTQKIRKPDGKKTYRHRPRDEWVIVEGAHPAIVEDDLWNAVEEVKRRKERYRAKKGGDRTAFSRYLLTGLVKCGECGGNYIVHAPRGQKRGRYAYYRCGYHQRRGDSVCANGTSVLKERVEGAVINLLQLEILTKGTVKMLIEDVRKAWNNPKEDGAKKGLRRVEGDLRKVDRELRNLVNAIKTTGISETLKAELYRCESRKASLEQTREELQQSSPQPDRLPTEQEIKEGLKGFRCLLESGTIRERQAVLEENIQEILVKPSGDVLLKVNPTGLLPDLPFGLCRGPDSNRYGPKPRGF